MGAEMMSLVCYGRCQSARVENVVTSKPFDSANIASASDQVSSFVYPIDMDDCAPLRKDDPETVSRTTKGFLDLPLEIRDLIYSQLLTASSRPDCVIPSDGGFLRTKWPRTFEGQCMFDLGSRKSFTSVDPTILRTCKQVHLEAEPFLYSENTFHLLDVRDAPENPFAKLAYIAPKIQSLDICAENARDLPVWLSFLGVVKDMMTRLRFLSITFGGENTWASGYRLGRSLYLVRAVSKIEGLEKLTLEGFYGKNWPAFLRARMSCEVVDYVGYQRQHSDRRLLRSDKIHAEQIQALLAACPEGDDADEILRYGAYYGLLVTPEDKAEFQRLTTKAIVLWEESTEDLDPFDDEASDGDEWVEDPDYWYAD